jgi:hypothetical protein
MVSTTSAPARPPRVVAHVDAVVAQARGLLGAAVPGADVVAGAGEVAGHRGAHDARAQSGDGGHARTLVNGSAVWRAVTWEPDEHAHRSRTRHALHHRHRAVSSSIPRAAGIEDLLERFEDDDEPVGSYGAEIAAQRIAEEAGKLDPQAEDPAVQLAAASRPISPSAATRSTRSPASSSRWRRAPSSPAIPRGRQRAPR